jgi:hypothetical protein
VAERENDRRPVCAVYEKRINRGEGRYRVGPRQHPPRVLRQVPEATGAETRLFLVAFFPFFSPRSLPTLGGHLKTGHTWTGQNRP